MLLLFQNQTLSRPSFIVPHAMHVILLSSMVMNENYGKFGN